MRRLILALAAAACAAPALAQTPPAAPATAPATPATGAEFAPSLFGRTAPTMEKCAWLSRVGGKLLKLDQHDLAPLQDRNYPAAPADGSLEGVICDRDSLVPGELDYRVVTRLRAPLFIAAPGGMTTVSIKEGRFSVSFTDQTKLTPQQQAAVKAVMQRWDAKAAGRR